MKCEQNFLFLVIVGFLRLLINQLESQKWKYMHRLSLFLNNVYWTQFFITEKPKFATSTPDQKKESPSDNQIANSNPECDIEGKNSF